MFVAEIGEAQVFARGERVGFGEGDEDGQAGEPAHVEFAGEQAAGGADEGDVDLAATQGGHLFAGREIEHAHLDLGVRAAEGGESGV